MPELKLGGCTPEPLMSYLKALGVFRLVAEQSDTDARLSWHAGVAHLHSRLDGDGLKKFFLEEYRPTPLMTPWNSASGFAPTKAGNKSPKDKTAREAVKKLIESRLPRLQPYSEAIRALQQVPRGEENAKTWKQDYFMRCRAMLPDSIVVWLDTCFALTNTDLAPFSLLGSGGNDGVADFGSLFMQRVCQIVESGSIETSRAWLCSSLFGEGLAPLLEDTVGQFNPGSTGGANAVQGKFEADSLVNPWDFVLMIEGAVLFAGSVARRMGSYTGGRAVFPFSVESVAVGYGSATASEETSDGSRAELWLPLWDGGCTLSELRHLFAEGRAQVGRRQAKNAVEFALAVNLLGVSRGVASFVRYGFLKRNGRAFLAAPLGRVEVCLRPSTHLLDDPPLVGWIDRLRAACRDKEKTPGRYQAALRHIDRAMFAFANRSEQGNDGKYLLDVMAALGSAERTLAGGLAFCKEKSLHPLQGLSAQWIDQGDDGSVEFRLAAALAGISSDPEQKIEPLRVFLEEVQRTKFVRWSPGSTTAVWSRQPLAFNLAAVFRRRQLEAFRAGKAGVPLYSPRPAALADVVAFLNEEIDADKLQDLLWGLIAVEYPPDFLRPTTTQTTVPFEFGVLRLLVQAGGFVPRGQRWVRSDDIEPNATPDPEVFHALASGQSDSVAECVHRAALRLRAGGLLVTGYRNRRLVGKRLAAVSPIRPERLLAAMLFPLSHDAIERLANAVLYSPESEE
jgi:CRISPR-associated protein Csx17